MAEDEIEQLSEEDLEEKFGPTADIRDELAEASALEPVEPLPETLPLPGDASMHKLSKSVRWFGIILTAFLGIQTLDIILRRAFPTTAPVGPYPMDDLGDVSVQDTLAESQEQLKQGLYEDVISVLQPFVESDRNLEPEHRFEINLLLAKAYRQIGDIERATHFTLLATDEVTRESGYGQIIERTQELLEAGRHAETRKIYFEILCRSDEVALEDRPFLQIAQIRVADTLLSEARARGGFPQLPGAPTPGGMAP